jgi:GNAT superfamily N-acetyltransferase
MTNTRLSIRPATLADLPSLHRVAERAVWSVLAGQHYTHEQMAAARAAEGYNVEPGLVADGTYYVLEVDSVVVGGSGWSGHSGFHPPLVGGAAAEPELVRGVAVMRASYVDPAWCRRGLGTLLAHTTEAAASMSGFAIFEAMCTPASEALRRKLGYRLLRRTDLPLIKGVSISMAHMRKELGPALRETAHRVPALAGED